jgi:hypothetical protein
MTSRRIPNNIAIVIKPPPGWQTIEQRNDGVMCKSDHHRLVVIKGIEPHDDGNQWIHVSVSRYDKALPTWDQLKMIKNLFIGPDKTALQVLPPINQHFSIAEVLHIYHCLNGDVTPDFTRGTGIL